ncbi:MAG: GNAT family N-acetyltransferase [Spirochaetia bacterium]|nr:GNAT family N-acetyltransferase [Spirochaetia bacterium]
MKTTDWENIIYLKTGTEKQKHVFEILNSHNILTCLKSYNPVLVSSICIDIDIPESDIDIICQYDNIEEFIDYVKSKFSKFLNFRQWDRSSTEVVTSFNIGNFIIEIFASTIPVKQQEGYRHLSIMARLLNIGGNILQDSIRSLKIDGYKSEAAFAKIIGLKGNPYHELLKLENYNDNQLKNILLNSCEVILKRTSFSELEYIADFEKDTSVSTFIYPYLYNKHCQVYNEKSIIYLTICRGVKVSGHIILNIEEGGNSIEFRRIVVYDKNRGIGSLAIENFEVFCKMNYDAKRIWLDVFSTNERAIHVYEKAGYTFFRSEFSGNNELLYYEKII